MQAEYFTVLVRWGEVVADIGGPYPTRLAAILALSDDARKLYATRPAPLDTETVGVSAPRYAKLATLPPLPSLPPLPTLPPLPKV